MEGPHNAAFIGAALTYFQDAPPRPPAIFYRGDAAWMGLFDLQGDYFKTAYTFKAIGAMLQTPERLQLSGADTFGFAAIAGRSRDGKSVQVLISNYQIPENYQPPPMTAPAGSAPKNMPMPDFSTMKLPDPRERTLRTGRIRGTS